MRRRILTSAFMAALPIPMMIPTSAAAADGWSLYGHSYPGAVSSSGALSWNGAYSFDYDFNVRDQCPADGRSAGVFFQVFAVGGGNIPSKTFWDSNGCGPAGVAYVGTISRTAKIDCVTVTLVSDDRGDSLPGVVEDGSGCKDNPYT